MIWPDDLLELNDLLINDGILLLPTDSVWGICCDATRPSAIHRILKLKHQQEGTGLVTLVSDMAMLKSYIHSIPPRLETLIALHQRPLTVLYKGVSLPQALQGPDESTALRVVKDPFIHDLIQSLGRPLVASTAGLWGETPPSHFGAISSHILENVDYVALWRRKEREEKEVSIIVQMNAYLELDFIRS